MTNPPRWEDLPDLLTAHEVMTYLRHDDIKTVYLLLSGGHIRCIGGRMVKGRQIRPPGDWRVHKSALRVFLDGEGA